MDKITQSSKRKDMLIKIRDWYVEIKFRIDISISFLTILNFTLLVITASDKLRNIIPLGTWALVLVLVPSAFIFIIFLGWFLDKVVNYQATYYKAQTDRVPQMTELLERVQNIEKILQGGKHEGKK